MEEKGEIRARMRALREKISIIEMAELSARICEKTLAMPEYQKAKTILCYASIDGEVSTNGLIRQIVASGKTLCLPVVRDKHTMDAVRLEAPDALRVGPFGIMEPTGNEVIGPDSIDLALVPGLAFDYAGNRVGYGAGYFDRYLKKCPAVFVGVAFQMQMMDAVPAGENDIRMRYVVTEERTYDCQKLGG